MGIHGSLNRHLVATGQVQKDGSKSDLGVGVLGFFPSLTLSGSPLLTLPNFKGLHRDEFIEFAVGDKRSISFKIGEIKKIKATAPKILTPEVDSIIVGFNGIDDSTALKGERQFIIEGRGKIANLLGFDTIQIPLPIIPESGKYLNSSGCPNGDCSELRDRIANELLKLTVKGIDFARNYEIVNSVKASQLVKINLISKCEQETPPKTFKQKYWTLELCDTGDIMALNMIRSQYGGLKVERISRTGAISTYKLTSKDDTTPADYTQTISSVIKGCEQCPADFAEVKGGFVYAVTLEDLGLDESATVGALPNAVATTVKRSGNGYYTLVLTKSLTAEERETFLTNNPTATISLVGETDRICEKNEVQTVSWKEAGSCKYTEAEFYIDLPDTKCGTERLEELQKAYPDLVIETEGTKGGCQTRYKTKTKTDVVCKECDPIFEGHYTTEAPANFKGYVWKMKEPQERKKCKVGFKVTAIPFSFHPEGCVEDKFGYVEDSLELSVREISVKDSLIPMSTPELAHQEYFSKKKNRDNLGGYFKNVEREGEVFFTGEPMGRYIEQVFTGKTSNLKSATQYVDFSIEIQKEVYAQSMGATHSHNNTYHILVEYGQHKSVLAMLQELASVAGVKPVGLV